MSTERPLIIDGHLDLAMNGLLGRDLSLPLDELRAREQSREQADSEPGSADTATVTFPELRAAGTRVCFGTLFALPRQPAGAAIGGEGYTDHAGARAQALAQYDQYLRWQDAGLLRLLSTGAQVAEHLAGTQEALGVVLLMEGADPIRDADELPEWVRRGVRVIGPAWGRTRYAGGTDAPGGLTGAGRALVEAMRDLGLTLDASHLDEAAFWDAAEIGPRMVATHSNSRALVSGNRHLSDDMARAIADADGVIGLVLLGRFIQEGWDLGQPKVSPRALLAHAEHYAALVGWDRVALGTDLDGGFGAEKTPEGIGRYADVPRWLDLLPAEHRAGVAGQNWARWLIRSLG